MLSYFTDSAVLSEKENALSKIQSLKAQAGLLIQEANELETKWGLAVSIDEFCVQASCKLTCHP